MKTLKLLGIAALSALLVFGVVACGDPEPKLLDDDVRIKVSSYGPYTMKDLKAVYNGDDVDDVEFQWYLNGEPIAGQTTQICRPQQGKPGRYEVRVTLEGYEDSTDNVDILEAPPYVDFFGKWTMDGSATMNDDWKKHAQGGNGKNINEYLEISENHYKLSNEVDGGGIQYFDFTINAGGWAAKSSASTVDNTYTSGYTITGTVTAQEGYPTSASITTISIYLKPGDVTMQVSDRSAIKRYYKRDPEI